MGNAGTKQTSKRSSTQIRGKPRGKKKAVEAARNGEEEYFLVNDVDVWEVFSSNHSSKILDRATLDNANSTPRHLVDTAPAPPEEDPAATTAWLQTRTLPCPICSKDLRRMINTQGAGGWHSVLSHLTSCRASAGRRGGGGRLEEGGEAFCEECVGLSVDAAIAGAWRKAAEASERRTHAREAAREQRKEKMAEPRADTEKKKAPGRLCCPLCERSFSASDLRSFEAHKAACRHRRDRKKHLHEIALEATSDKAQKAELQVAEKAEALQKARETLREERRKGCEYAERAKRERRVAEHAAAQAKRRGAKAPTSYYTSEASEERQGELQVRHKSLERAERRVKAAQQQLEAAKKHSVDRAQVAEAVRGRAEESRITSAETARAAQRARSAPPRVRGTTDRQSKAAFLPAHKRGKAAAAEQPEAKKKDEKKRKKASKEELAAEARRKSEAKRDRRQGRPDYRALGAFAE